MFESFAFGWIADKALEAVVAAVAGDSDQAQLDKRFRRECRAWEESLDKGERCRHTALFDVRVRGETTLNGQPRVTKARDKIAELLSDLTCPSTDDWTEALLERWNEVRASAKNEGLAAFFTLGEERARKLLSDLARRIDRVITSDARFSARTNLVLLRSLVEQAPPRGASHALEVGPTDASATSQFIEKEIEPLWNDLPPRECATALKKVLERRGATLNAGDLCELRVRIGQALVAANEVESGAKELIDIAEAFTESSRAQALGAIAISLLGDHSRAVARAKEVRQLHPDSLAAEFVEVELSNESATTLCSGASTRLRESLDGQLLFAWRFLEEGQLDEAHEQARLAMRHGVAGARALEMLGSVWLAKAIRIAQEAGGASHVSETRISHPCKEALQSLERALELSRARISPEHEASLNLKIGYAYELMGSSSAAYEHARRSFSLDPSNHSAAVRVAVGDYADGAEERGIELLRRVLVKADKGTAAELTFAAIAIAKGDADLILEAVGRLVDILEGGSVTQYPKSVPASLIVDAMRYKSVRVRIDNGPVEVALRNLSCLGRLVAESRLALWDGNLTDAREKARRAAGLITPEVSPAERLSLAELEQSVGETELAFQVLRGGVDWGALTPITKAALDAAVRIGEYRFACELARKLRDAGCLNEFVVDRECNALEQLHHLQSAIVLLKDVLKQGLDTPYFRLKLSRYAALDGDQAFIERDAARLPSIEDCSVGVGQALVQHAASLGDTERATDLACTLVRRYPDEAGAHLELIALGLRGQLHCRPFAAVVVGCAVEVEDLATGEVYVRHVVIDGEESGGLNEITATSSLGEALSGRAVGDSVEVKGKGLPVKLKVRAIRDSRLQLSIESRETFRMRFPGDAVFESIKVDVGDPHSGRPADLSKFFEKIDQREEHVSAVIERYESQPMTIGMLGRLTGVDTVEAVAAFRGDARLRLDVAVPTKDGVDAARRAVRSGEVFVVDASALAALILGGLGPPEIAMRVVVPEAVTTELQTLLVRWSRSEERLTVHKVGDRYVRSESGPVGVDEIRRLGLWIDWCRQHGPVAVWNDGPSLLDSELHKKLSGMLTHGETDALAIAVRRGCTLWTDDRRLAMLAASLGVKARVWTQPVLEELMSSGALGSDYYYQHVRGMLIGGDLRAYLSVGFMLEVVSAAQASMDSLLVRACLATICEKGVSRVARMGVIAGVLAKSRFVLEITAYVEFQRLAFTALLDAEDRELIVAEFDAMLDVAFGVDVLGGMRARRAFKAAAAGRSLWGV